MLLLSVVLPLVFFFRLRPRAKGAGELLRASARTGWLTRGHDGLYIPEQGILIESASVRRGWIVPGGHGPYVVLELNSGVRYLLGVNHLAEAQQILMLASTGLDVQALHIPLSSRAMKRGFGLLGTWFLLYFVYMVTLGLLRAAWSMLRGVNVTRLVLLAGLLAAVYAIVRATWSFLKPGKIKIGRDGFVVQQSKVQRFIAYKDVQSIEKVGSVVSVQLDQESVELSAKSLFEDGADRLAAIQMRLDDAWRAFTNRDAYRGNLIELERRGKDMGSWYARLKKVVTQQSYRNQGLTIEQLLDIATDPGAKGEHRIAAFVAMSGEAGAQEPKHQQKLRIAVDGCARPKLRRALEAAMRQDPSAAIYEEALAEEEAQEHAARVGR